MTTDPESTIAAKIQPYKMSSEMHVDFCNALAQDFKRTARYVAFDGENLKTFSIEYVRLLLDTCSEIEALAKLNCNKLFDEKETTPRLTKKNPTINHWRAIIVATKPTFSGIGIQVFNQARFYPWKVLGGQKAV